MNEQRTEHGTTIVVAGSTGTVGSRVAARLTAAGHGFRALVRDASRASVMLGPGAEIVAADFSRPDTLGPALEGAERLFLLVPDMPGDAKLELEANAVDAAKAAGVRHIVYLSVTARDKEPQFALARLHHETERRIERSGLAWTHLRPIAFMSNLLFSVESINSDGAFYLPTGDGKLSVIDPDDIAAVAVEALLGHDHEGKTYTLTGPEALSYDEQAAQLSEAIGREIRYVDVPEDAARRAMKAAGMPSEVVEDLLEFYALVKAGERTSIAPDFEQVMGREPRTFASFVRDNAGAFE